MLMMHISPMEALFKHLWRLENAWITALDLGDTGMLLTALNPDATVSNSAVLLHQGTRACICTESSVSTL